MDLIGGGGSRKPVWKRELCERHSTTTGTHKLHIIMGYKVITRIATAQNLHVSWVLGSKGKKLILDSLLLRCLRQKRCQTSNLPDMDVSKNSGTPKSSILIGFSIIFTIHFGVPLFLETPIYCGKKVVIFIPWQLESISSHPSHWRHEQTSAEEESSRWVVFYQIRFTDRRPRGWNKCIVGCFLKWWYPQKNPKWSF